MNIDDLTIKQVREIAEMFAALQAPIPQEPQVNHGLSIVVLDRGFVYIGHVSTDVNWCRIRNAKNIRRWGTTRGLGQLALEGPTSDTKLDDYGNVNAPMRAVISIIYVEEGRWDKLF